MTSEIEQEVEENIEKMEDLISHQKFTVKDGQAFLKRAFNFLRRLQQLEKSRDNWKKKYIELTNKVGLLK